jgi:hypothetical protein
MSNLQFAVRGPNVDDTALIFSSWLKSSLASPAYQHIPSETFFYFQHRIIETYVSDATAAWLIACNPDDPRFVYGWLCGQVVKRANESISPTIHYVYVKQKFRRMGVASQLVRLFGVNEHVACITTSWTPKGDELLASMGVTQLYNPFTQWGRAPVVDQVPPERLKRHQKLHDRAVKASRKALAFDPGVEVED